MKGIEVNYGYNLTSIDKVTCNTTQIAKQYQSLGRCVIKRALDKNLIRPTTPMYLWKELNDKVLNQGLLRF